MLAAECRLLLAAECRGKSKSSEAAIVASFSSWKCSLLTSMQKTGSLPVFGVGSARWPDGPPQSDVAHGFSLIPVSGVGVAVDEVKTGVNSGTSRSDMVADGITLEKQTQNR